MMNKLDELLEYVRRTNPNMTKDRLIKELSVSRYSYFALVFTFENTRNQKYNENIF